MTITAGAALLSVVFVFGSIFPANFIYLSANQDLVTFARGLDEDELAATTAGIVTVDALTNLKNVLLDQYAAATDHNRRINQRRARFRARAGIATLFCLLGMIGLVATVFLGYSQPS